MRIPQIGYPPGRVAGVPIELITTGYPPFDVSYGLDSRRPEASLVLSILAPPIISIQCILQDRDPSYILYPILPVRSTILAGLLPGGVRSGPIELETTGYQLGGIPYRALLSFGFRGNSYAARWLSDP